jgi:hypothetical protein
MLTGHLSIVCQKYTTKEAWGHVKNNGYNG